MQTACSTIFAKFQCLFLEKLKQDFEIKRWRLSLWVAIYQSTSNKTCISDRSSQQSSCQVTEAGETSYVCKVQVWSQQTVESEPRQETLNIRPGSQVKGSDSRKGKGSDSRNGKFSETESSRICIPACPCWSISVLLWKQLQCAVFY